MFMLNTCFLPGSLECQYTLGRGYLYEQPPIKSSGAESFMGFPGQKYYTHIATFSLLGEVCDLCKPLLEGESIGDPANRFLQTMCLFPLRLNCVSLLHRFDKS